MEYRFRRHDGEHRWVLETGVPRFDASSEFLRCIASCVDIAERKWTELALRGSRDELKWEMTEQSAELAAATSRLLDEIIKRERAEHLLKNSDYLN